MLVNTLLTFKQTASARTPSSPRLVRPRLENQSGFEQSFTNIRVECNKKWLGCWSSMKRGSTKHGDKDVDFTHLMCVTAVLNCRQCPRARAPPYLILLPLRLKDQIRFDVLNTNNRFTSLSTTYVKMEFADIITYPWIANIHIKTHTISVNVVLTLRQSASSHTSSSSMLLSLRLKKSDQIHHCLVTYRIDQGDERLTQSLSMLRWISGSLQARARPYLRCCSWD